MLENVALSEPSAQIAVVPFKAEHARAINPAADIKSFVGLKTFAETALVAGTPVAAAGFFVLWPGVGEAWTIFHQGVEPRTALRCLHTARQRLGALATRAGVHRLQAAVPLDNPSGLRLATVMGFEVEGVAHRYGSDKRDYMRFERMM